MANRNSTALTLPGNPLGSVLREVARDQRRSTRDPNATQFATEEEFAALQAQIETLQGQVLALQGQLPLGHAIVTSNAFGLLTFTYPSPNPFPPPAVPIIHALPLVPDNANITVSSAGQTSAILGVVNAATGAAYPNIPIFLTAFPSALVP